MFFRYVNQYPFRLVVDRWEGKQIV